MTNKLLTCPDICPKGSADGVAPQKEYAGAGASRNVVDPNRIPYTPGMIEMSEKTVYPPDAPPIYLPQSTDTTSGDILGMGPIGPWAPGHLDWTPQAGMTGVRPVVEKYSITKYNTGQWRVNNQSILQAKATGKAKTINDNAGKDLKDAFKDIDKNHDETNVKLKARITEVDKWKIEAEKTITRITEEIDALDQDRTKLKGACRILMMPEAIAKECLELRTHRYEPDLVRDKAEQELIKEVAIVGEIRKIFQDTLNKVEEQMVTNKAAKTAIESDWSDKLVSSKQDHQTYRMRDDSNLTLFHPGGDRWPENATSLEYWKHYCKESIRNCEEIRQQSKDLRTRLSSLIANGAQDMKTQSMRTNVALAETVDATQKMLSKLEEALKANLDTTAKLENTIILTKQRIGETNIKNKLVMTRLHSRNYERPGVENCRDDAQYSLMGESKLLRGILESLNNKLRHDEAVRSELIKERGALEKDIACKRKSLLIDEDRLSRLRVHMPTAEEFASVGSS